MLRYCCFGGDCIVIVMMCFLLSALSCVSVVEAILWCCCYGDGGDDGVPMVQMWLLCCVGCVLMVVM